jgi:hypothetical protein
MKGLEKYQEDPEAWDVRRDTGYNEHQVGLRLFGHGKWITRSTDAYIVDIAVFYRKKWETNNG